MEWMTIDSAPKDGRPLILFGDLNGEVNIREKAKMVVGNWDYGMWQVESSDAYAVEVDATHWMPLPSPPKAPE